MGRQAKRTRTTATQTASTGITIVSKIDPQGYVYHLVQGWQEEGKWKRKRFKERSDAETFAASLRVSLENQGRAQRMVLSPLTDVQHEEALSAFDRLGETYSLNDAVTFFLRHHRPPEFTILLADAIKIYVDDKERDGLRSRSVKGIKWTLELFCKATDNPHVHKVTSQEVEAFLRALRAKNGVDRATRRSWEIHRGALNGFFSWAGEPDAGSNRPFTFANPIEKIRKFSARQVREEQSAKPATTSVDDVLRMFSLLMRWRKGIMVRSFSLLYFAGIRPDELLRLSGREAELLNLKTRALTIPANVAKTRHERQVVISDNLAKWLGMFPGPIFPTNFQNLMRKVRRHFSLTHDEARHSFISYHVAKHRSVGDAALQAGNSEYVVKRHYLNTHTRGEGEQFFSIVPGNGRAVMADQSQSPESPILKVVGS